MSIALKESCETEYWIDLLQDDFISEGEAISLKRDLEEILKLLVSIVKTSKQ